jgi:hypothetical protein
MTVGGVQVVTKRIADDVPMIIDQDFITKGISDTQTVRAPPNLVA